jgi:hypothetical protein
VRREIIVTLFYDLCCKALITWGVLAMDGGMCAENGLTDLKSSVAELTEVRAVMLRCT